MKGNFRSLLRKFCLDGSIVGFKYFYLYPDKLSRCFWGLFMLLVLYMACIITYLLYRRFEALPTRITIENQFEPVAKLPFPAITICSPNQITTRALQHFDKTLINGNRSFDLTHTLPQLLGFYHFVNNDEVSLKELQNLIELNRYTVPEVMALLPQNCEEFLKACVFQKRRYPRCRGLFHPVLTKHGLCCIFNSPYYYKTHRRNEQNMKFTPHLVNKAGYPNGLTVIADFHPEDAVDKTIYFAGAIRVMFTDWTEFPSDDETTAVAPATESFHMIHATATYCSSDVKELPPTSRKCTFMDEKHLPFFWQYRNSDCDLLCLVHAIEDRCQCLMFYLPHLRSQQVCDVTSIKCVSETKLNLNEWMEKDQCVCPRDCDSRQYRIDITTGNFKAVPYMYYKPFNNLQLNESSSIMHFFFPTPVYEKQKQETVMSLTTLASNLGGVFGLCMGCSVISVLEVLFYYYSATKNMVRGRLKKTMKKPIGRLYYE